MSPILYVFLGYLLLINLISFFTCFWDKRSAIRHRRRVSEKRLFALAWLGGSVGMYAGMLLFRHKTKHWYFMLGIPAILLLEVAAGVLVYLYLWSK